MSGSVTSQAARWVVLLRKMLALSGIVLIALSFVARIPLAREDQQLLPVAMLDVICLLGMFALGIWFWWSFGLAIWANRKRRLYVSLVILTFAYIAVALQVALPGPSELNPVLSGLFVALGGILLLAWKASSETPRDKTDKRIRAR
jgi:hypothetical protein